MNIDVYCMTYRYANINQKIKQLVCLTDATSAADLVWSAQTPYYGRPLPHNFQVTADPYQVHIWLTMCHQCWLAELRTLNQNPYMFASEMILYEPETVQANGMNFEAVGMSMVYSLFARNGMTSAREKHFVPQTAHWVMQPVPDQPGPSVHAMLDAPSDGLPIKTINPISVKNEQNASGTIQPFYVSGQGNFNVVTPVDADEHVIPLYVETPGNSDLTVKIRGVEIGPGKTANLPVDLKEAHLITDSNKVPVHLSSAEPDLTVNVKNSTTTSLSKDADGKDVRVKTIVPFTVEGLNNVTIGDKTVNAIWTTTTNTPAPPASSVTIAGVANGINIPVYTRSKSDPTQSGETEDRWIDIRTKDNIVLDPQDSDIYKNIVSMAGPCRKAYNVPSVPDPIPDPWSDDLMELRDSGNGACPGGIYDPFNEYPDPPPPAPNLNAVDANFMPKDLKPKDPPRKYNKVYGRRIDKEMSPSLHPMPTADYDITAPNFLTHTQINRCISSLDITGNAVNLAQIKFWNTHAKTVQGASFAMHAASHQPPAHQTRYSIPIGGWPLNVSGPPRELENDILSFNPVRVAGKEYFMPNDVNNPNAWHPKTWEPVWTASRLFISKNAAVAHLTATEPQYVSGIPMETNWRRWTNYGDPNALQHGGNFIRQGFHEPVRVSGVNTGLPQHAVVRANEDSNSQSFEWRPAEVASGYYNHFNQDPREIKSRLDATDRPVPVKNQPTTGPEAVSVKESAIKIVGADLGVNVGIGGVWLMPGSEVKVNNPASSPVHTDAVIAGDIYIDANTSRPLPVCLKDPRGFDPIPPAPTEEEDDYENEEKEPI